MKILLISGECGVQVLSMEQFKRFFEALKPQIPESIWVTYKSI